MPLPPQTQGAPQPVLFQRGLPSAQSKLLEAVGVILGKFITGLGPAFEFTASKSKAGVPPTGLNSSQCKMYCPANTEALPSVPTSVVFPAGGVRLYRPQPRPAP